MVLQTIDVREAGSPYGYGLAVAWPESDVQVSLRLTSTRGTLGIHFGARECDCWPYAPGSAEPARSRAWRFESVHCVFPLSVGFVSLLAFGPVFRRCGGLLLYSIRIAEIRQMRQPFWRCTRFCLPGRFESVAATC